MHNKSVAIYDLLPFLTVISVAFSTIYSLGEIYTTLPKVKFKFEQNILCILLLHYNLLTIKQDTLEANKEK